MNARIGFVGMGIMGRPMAGHLQAGGHELFVVKHRAPLPQAFLDGGAIECASRKEVAQRAEVIIIMVPDTLDVAAVLFVSADRFVTIGGVFVSAPSARSNGPKSRYGVKLE